MRRAIQSSQESLIALAARYDINPKTVHKWRKRSFVADAPMGPKPRSTALSTEQEAIIVAFRKHTLLPFDDCLYALQAAIPQLTRSALHRCLLRHGINRLPEMEGRPPAQKKKFKAYPIGYFHIDLTEVRTEEGKPCLFVAVDRISKFAFAQERRRKQVLGDKAITHLFKNQEPWERNPWPLLSAHLVFSFWDAENMEPIHRTKCGE